MNAKTWLSISLGLGLSLLVSACDHKGSHAGEGGTLAGLWINSAAFDDFRRTANDPRSFCDLIDAKRSAYHTFEEDGSNRPRVIEVTPNGDVLRWSPKDDDTRRSRARHPVIMGIERLRLTGLNSMVRRAIDGVESYTRADERSATIYVHRLERCDHGGREWSER